MRARGSRRTERTWLTRASSPTAVEPNAPSRLVACDLLGTAHASRACPTWALCCETRASPGSLYCETRASPGFGGDPHGPMVCRLRPHLRRFDGCPARVQRGVRAGRLPDATGKISRSV